MRKKEKSKQSFLFHWQSYFRVLICRKGQALTGFWKNHPRFAAVFFQKTLTAGTLQ
jgi:hypothetical protein